MNSENVQKTWSSIELEFFKQIKSPKDTSENIKKNTQYYLKKFQLFQNGETKLGWNWAAFILGSIWGTYRNIYIFLFIDIGFIIVQELFELFLILKHPSQEVRDLYYLFFGTPLLIIYITYRVILALKANLIYIKKTETSNLR